MYTYKAIITAVYDGDTITADIDLGFRSWLKKVKLRLFGINTPEVRGENKERGKLVRDIVRDMILDKEVILRTYKDKQGKYGRWLADVYIEIDGKEVHLNQWLVEQNMAVPYLKD